MTKLTVNNQLNIMFYINNKDLSFSLKNIIYTVLFALLFSCAHPVNPGGGPKDKEPPKVLASFPENGSANFTTNQFTVDFDEYIELKDIHNEALISPPLLERPDFKVKGKTLLVEFNEPLKENTTYSIYFGDAITDITEGNPISNYTYIFSTGTYVDSLSLQGKVLNAYDHQVVEECFVMLYKDDNDTISLDSLPLLLRPYYLSKTDEKGRFRFNGLGDDKYLMFAIVDMNASLSFDQPSEQIAFIDSLISPSFVKKPKIDTTLIDSSSVVLADSVPDVASDSLLKVKDNLFSTQLKTYELFLYTEKDTVLKFMGSKIIRDNTLQFVFNIPANDVSIIPLNYADREIWHYVNTSKNADTITWYYKKLPVDTLELLVKHNLDTLDLLTIRLNKQTQRPGKKRIDKPKALTWEANPSSKILKPFTSPKIDFYQPIDSIDFDSVVLIAGNDTILNPIYYFTDSLKMQIEIPVENVEDTRYKVVIPDSVIYDWNGLTNEKLLAQFSTKPLSEYGTFILNVSIEKEQAIILQLLTEDEAILKQDFITRDTVLVYKYLNAGKHKIKAIFDANNNGEWDPGLYLKKKQAEKVIYYKNELEIRANWDIEENWEID